MAMDEEFLKTNLIINKASFNKGFAFIGMYGVGKTLLFEVARQIKNVRNPISPFMFSSHHLTESLRNTGKLLKSYTKKPAIFDEFGEENKSFGNLLSGEVLELRKFNNVKTHITTNLTKKEVEERYGVRVWERVKEMCNIVFFENTKSLRK